MTAEVKDELSRLVVSAVSARRAEVTSLLRFAGGLHIVAGRVVVEAEVDLGSIARRLRKDIFDLYGYNAVVHVLSASGIRKTTRYVLRVANDGEALARQTGLLDLRGRPVRGLPAQVVGGSIGDAEAAWRGAFLAHGSLTEPGRSSALEVSCPGPEAALALVGAARRLGISAKAREVRGADRVVVRDGEALARQTGLLDLRGRPVRGLPAQVVGGSIGDAEAAWRGAFLAHGSLTEPGRSSALEVSCPGPEAALALVGAARRLGISAKAREVRGADRVVVRDGEAIGALLTRMGAQDTRLVWEERRMRREVRATANRLANFDDANLRRSARAAVAAAARVERALEILGDTVPDHLAAAGKLRIEHRQASLEELGRLADPQMTKDAVAGRIRRLLSMADRKAKVDGIPDTESAVTPDLMEDA
ncbi:MAG TPA: DNA-binding protein WhiA [Mycobacterium sp.]|nr:DNA-binding protein WhiA [Mycobacterium sp.]